MNAVMKYGPDPLRGPRDRRAGVRGPRALPHGLHHAGARLRGGLPAAAVLHRRWRAAVRSRRGRAALPLVPRCVFFLKCKLGFKLFNHVGRPQAERGCLLKSHPLARESVGWCVQNSFNYLF